MSLYLLDTDWIVDVLNGQEAATQTLIELAPHGLALRVQALKQAQRPKILAEDFF